MSASPVNVAVTGAAGQIGYALLFRIASGQLLGPDVPVRLRLLEITPALKAAEGTAMELDDCAFPLLAGIDITDDARAAFDGVNVALLVGARPRTAGMERGDLLSANGGIFKPQGEALNAGAADDVRVLVVGNPANTNALIALVPRTRRTPRAVHGDDAPGPQPGAAASWRPRPRSPSTTSSGSRSGATTRPRSTPTSSTPRSAAGSAAEVVDDQAWLENDFIPTVAKRGAAIIEARGASSAASAANAADRPRPHLGQRHRRRVTGPRWPCPPTARTASPRAWSPRSRAARSVARWEIVAGPRRSTTSRASRIDASVAELVEERDAVRALGLI